MKPTGLIRLGRKEGVAGRSSTWEIDTLGQIRTVSWVDLIEGLRSGRYSGIESVRREDGDWGPLFGRPMYREVFGGDEEPRDSAKARAAARIARLGRLQAMLLGYAIGAVVLALPIVSGGLLGQLFLLLALGLGIGTGWVRLHRSMHAHELATLTDRCVPPVLPPPPLEPDWAQLAAEDEVRAALEAEQHGSADTSM